MKQLVFVLILVTLSFEIFLVRNNSKNREEIKNINHIFGQIDQINIKNLKLDKEILLFSTKRVATVDNINLNISDLNAELINLKSHFIDIDFSGINFFEAYQHKFTIIEKIKSFSGVSRNSLNYLMGYESQNNKGTIEHLKNIILRFHLDAQKELKVELLNVANAFSKDEQHLKVHVIKYLEFRDKISVLFDRLFSKNIEIENNKIVEFLSRLRVQSIERENSLQLLVFVNFSLLLSLILLQLYLIRKGRLDHERAQKMLTSVVEASREAIISIDSRGIINLVNQFATDITGFEKEELIGSNISIIIPSPHKVRHDEYITRFLQTGESQIIGKPRELTLVHKKGHEVPIILSVADFEIDGKKYFSGVLHDISEIVDTRKKMAITSRLASIGELASGVGHEINNPLAIIKSTTDILQKLLEKETIDKQKMNEYIEKQISAIDRIRSISDGLRTYSRMDISTFSVVNLTDIIQSTINLIEGIYLQESIKLKTQFCCEKSFVRANKGKIQQVIMNLLSNARDALSDVEDATIEINLEKKDDFFNLTIKDNGSGISENDQKKIFESFFTTKEVGKGTGLGLSIVKNFVEEVEGVIELSSKIGNGTCFTLRFPVADQQLISTTQEFQRNQIIEDTFEVLHGSVLLADDDPDLHALLKDTLELWGLKVLSAFDGEEALESFQKNKVDLLITDIKMPKMNGIELIEKVVENKPFKIIAISGGVDFKDTEDFKKVVDKHTNVFLQKPFELSQLYQAVRKTLS